MSHHLLTEDIDRIVRWLPVAVVDLMKARPSILLGGGFIRAIIAGETPSDVDLFTSSEEEARWAVEFFSTYAKTAKTISTKNAHTIEGHSYPIQIIHRWTFNTADALISSFDFTIAAAAIGFDPVFDPAESPWYGVMAENFYSDLAAKRLRYTQPERNEDAGGSMIRVLKFYQRGYRIPLSDVALVIARLTKGLDTKDETALGTSIAARLYEVDPSANPAHHHLTLSRNAEEYTPPTTPTENSPA